MVGLFVLNLMKETILTINSISHHHWADRPEELLREAAGCIVLLVRERENVDPNAVRVHFRAEVAGYVCAQEAPLVAGVMDATSRDSLPGRVTGTVTEPYYKLKVTCSLPSTEDSSSKDLEQNKQYEQWEYSGPVMPLSEDEKQLQGAMEYLGYVLMEQLPWDSQAEENLSKFLTFHRLDCSDETFRFRGSLLRFLSGSHSEEAARLEAELHELSRHEFFDGLARRLSELYQTTEFADMMRRTGHLNTDQLADQLLAFPGDLAVMKIRDMNYFARRLYYVHPPRHVLRRFLSGLALQDFVKHNGVGMGGSAAKAGGGGFAVDKLINLGTINDF